MSPNSNNSQAEKTIVRTRKDNIELLELYKHLQYLEYEKQEIMTVPGYYRPIKNRLDLIARIMFECEAVQNTVYDSRCMKRKYKEDAAAATEQMQHDEYDLGQNEINEIFNLPVDHEKGNLRIWQLFEDKYES